MSDGEIRVTIQAVEPSADNPMAPAGGGDIRFELKKIYPNAHWQLQYIMPGPFDHEQHVASMQEWNEAMKKGCFTLGGPMPTITDTPDLSP